MKDIAGTVIASRKVTLWLLIALLAAGCASVSDTRDTRSVDEVGDAQDMSRAKRVFLYQSHVGIALLNRYPLIEVLENADSSVLEAEARMAESCGPLTHAVLAHFEGDKISLGLRLRVMATIGDCEHAAQKMDELLNSAAIANSM